MTVGIYIRVSTDEQAKEGYSLSAQRERLKAFCIAQDWHDFKFYVEEGVSGRTTKRPKLKELLQHVEQGSINTLLVYRLDRLTRSVRDLHNLLDKLDKNGCTFKSATEIYDTSTAMGRMFITIIASIAQWESENLGERVRMGQIEKARQGEWSAQPPFGYNKIDKRLIINPEEKEVILDMIEKVKSGYSMRKLALYLESTEIKPVRGKQWHITSIRDMLTNPALYGAMRWRDEIIEDTHEGILTKKEFEKLVQLISSRRNHKKRDVKSIFIFQMKIKCPTCGSHLSSERSVYTRKSDKTQVETNNYRCQVCALANRKPPFRISELKLENALMEYMKDLILDVPKDVVGKNKNQSEAKKLIDSINKLENQRNKYQRAWAQNLMTDKEFTDLMNETKGLLEELKLKLSEVQDVSIINIDHEEVKLVAKSFISIWDSMTSLEKKSFVEQFITSIDVEKISGKIGRGFRDHVYEVTNVNFV